MQLSVAPPLGLHNLSMYQNALICQGLHCLQRSGKVIQCYLEIFKCGPANHVGLILCLVACFRYVLITKTQTSLCIHLD